MGLKVLRLIGLWIDLIQISFPIYHMTQWSIYLFFSNSIMIGVSGLFETKDGKSSVSSSHPALKGILTETLVAVYVGLSVCALYTRDAAMLYRLVTNVALGDANTWSRVFGGVYRLKPARPPPPPPSAPQRPSMGPSVPPPSRPSPTPSRRTTVYVVWKRSSLKCCDIKCSIL